MSIAHESLGNHSIRNYILISLGGLLILGCCITAFFFISIYPTKTIDYIETVYTNKQMPLSEELEEYIQSLRGTSYAKADIDLISAHIESFQEVSHVELRKRYPGNLYITITSSVPYAVLQLSEDGFLRIKCLDGTERLVTDIILKKDGSLMYGYDAALRVLRDEVPVFSMQALDDVMIHDSRIGIRLREYLDMLHTLMNEAPEIYNLITEIKYDNNSSKEIEIGISDAGYDYSYTVVDPMTGKRLEQAIRATIYLAKREKSSKVLSFTLLDTYAVMNRQ